MRALKETAGPSIILDHDLRIVAGTPGVEEILGGPLPRGMRAPQVLCGTGDRRPVAEALARGESAAAEIARPTPNGELIVAVRTAPLRDESGIAGHLLMLTPLALASQGITEKHGIQTRNEGMRSLLRIAEKVAASDASILVRGETGSGKELIARAIHEMSPRRGRPFFAINCAALPPQLIESELFGHVRGAFTGAVRDTEGSFRRAEGGTVFLDEVAELPLEVQAKLLRVTQERTVFPVGSSRAIPVNVRLISATHRSLRAEINEGRFRADLMYRLRVIPLFLPSLRQRPEDIEPLVSHFLKRQNEINQSRTVSRVSPGALKLLQDYAWPGNVRELSNVVEYAFLLGEGPVLSEGELPAEIRGEMGVDPPSAVASEDPPSREAQRILRALERAAGSRTRAAASLGISRSTLWRRMKEHGLDVD